MQNDYYTKLLKVYFNDLNIGRKEQLKLYESNPFDDKFSKWEHDYHKENRLMGRFLRRNGIDKHKMTIEELTAIGDETITKYLDDGRLHDDYNQKKNNICLVHDNLYGNSLYLSDVIKNKPHFAIGICTNNKKAYMDKLKYYKEMIKKHNDIKIIEGQEAGYDICIVKR